MSQFQKNIDGINLSKLLNALGIIYLIAAVILAVTIFFGYGRVTVESMYNSHSELNWTAIFTAIGVIFQGALVSCLALGLGRVLDKCEEITYKLYNNDNSVGTTKYLRCKNCGEFNEDTGYTRRCKKCDSMLINADVIEM